ncbi:rab-GTPase-TBC domain-containing protein [Lipomyces tetrasporus]|uniref:Rab-GTPase-TBC domain-containing protein n=1 Tax=Lipomyces tetrasporus TaxID=54092 RepID=A0AAD7VSD5_9ASCO|nr:rab-GTPase-TBC domain-containing protein [Lipomyces tetrasporus]KAJ8099926.1 rab-GTPase-TBC domain-containing protein [Lipomyces tetrasporus]
MTSVHGAGSSLRRQPQPSTAKPVPGAVESPEFLASPYSIFRDILRPSSPPSPPSFSSTAAPSFSSTTADEASPPTTSSLRHSMEAVRIPANLHTSPDAAVQDLVDRHGGLSVVRQLAADLAMREREVNYLLRMHDEKMKVLSGMLRHKGVSDDEIRGRVRAVEVRLSRESLSDSEAGSEIVVQEKQECIKDTRTDGSTPDTVVGIGPGSLLKTRSREDNQDDAEVFPAITFRRAALKQQQKPQDSPASSRTIRKTKSAFRLPFFWKSESDEDLPSTAAPITTSTPSLHHEHVASSSASTQSDPTAKRNRRAFAIPLFPEDNSLPPVISPHASKSSIRNNVNNYFKGATELSVKSAIRRKQQIVAPEREDAVHEEPMLHGNAEEQEYDDEGVEEDISSDDLANSGGSFKSAVQSQYDDDSARPATDFRATKKIETSPKSAEKISEPEKLRSTSYNTDDEFDDDEEDDEEEYEIIGEKKPRKSPGFESTFSILRRRSESRSRALVRSHLGENVPEWLPHSLKEGSSSVHTHTTSIGNHGPVELGDIVPQSMQPPTLLQSWNDHYRSEDTYLLTDRFGFIYDRQHRPVLPPIESTVGSRLLDLDSLDFLFDHSDEIGKPEPAHLSDEKDTSLFRQGLPIPSLKIPIGRTSNRTTSLESATSSTEAPEDDTLDAVKLLLNQLTDLHDSLQRVQKSRWDEFLRKINGDGSDDSPVAIENGELFGVHGRVLHANKHSRFKEFKALVLGGIPVVYRSKIWGECCGADNLKVPGVYEELVHGEHDPEPMSQIELDLYRTMPSNVFFGGKGPGVGKLRRVLLAFSKRNPAIGYCQGMNMIAATLLLTHATEDAAFWSFVALLENILPSGYFDPPLLTSRADQRVLKHYLKELQPKLYDHLVTVLGVDIEAITFNWFLSVFTDCLTAEVLFRVWDVFMCVEGEVYLFRVALALFRISTKNLMQLTSAAEVYSYMKDMASHPISIEGLIRLSDSLRQQVRLDDVVARRKRVIGVMHQEMGF